MDEIVSYSDTLVEANHKLKKAEYTSYLSSSSMEEADSEGRGKRKRMPKKRILPGETSDEVKSEIEEDPFPDFEDNSLTHNGLPQREQPNSEIKEMFAEIIDRLNKIENKIDRLERRQQEIVKEKTLDDSFWADFPLESLEHFDTVEAKFVDPMFSNKFTEMVLSIGHGDCKSAINDILRKVMSDEVAVNFSYTGKPPKDGGPPKRAFKQTILCHKMHLALQKAFPANSEVNRRQNMAVWFQQAKFRIMRRHKNSPEEMVRDPFEI